MIYPYLTLADETEIVHTGVIDKDGVQTVEVHFERPISTGFKSARAILPSYEWLFNDGFDRDEIAFFEEFLKSNAHLIYRFAQNGGISCA